MLRALLFLVLFGAYEGHAQLQFSDSKPDLGTIQEACEIKGDLVIRNASDKKVYLMRADAESGVKVYASRKTLLPGDTSLLVISFFPDSKGRFKKQIRLVSSDQAAPYLLSLSGNLLKLRTDDKTACYYFGSQRQRSVTVTDQPLVVEEPKEKRDVSNRLPDPGAKQPAPATSKPPEAPKAREAPKPTEESAGELPLLSYKPNNILFLVDVSGSMKDSLKLPLMKTALQTLIDAVREVDYITFVTYADTVRVLSEAVKGSEKKQLHEVVRALRAKGLTKGNKAILYSQQLAQQHFIAEGNNQIFLATDGKFKFNSKDFEKWTAQQGDKPVILSTVAFGSDHEALQNLKDIADQCGGSFIHIKKVSGARDKLLDEVKERSRR